ncbi:hypothetical protein [Nocardiopsis chromatogenes]|uniref:hypothetical protein n=1 Tax=Nocardiopsis chromatogenes TaxID=280239 RepID=UPI00034C880F|nr:hypothetical protein [Nocardiopsis chromatogenes]
MGRHVAAWFTTFVLDMVAVLVLAYLMGDTGAALGMAAGGVALAGVAVLAVADGAAGGAALLFLLPASLAAPVGAVTSAEVATGRPVASVVQGDETGSGTTVPLVETGLRSEVGPDELDGEPGVPSPCVADAATCPPTVVSEPSEGATDGPGGGTDGGTERGGTGEGTEGGDGTGGIGGTGEGEGTGGWGGGPSPGASVGP